MHRSVHIGLYTYMNSLTIVTHVLFSMQGVPKMIHTLCYNYKCYRSNIETNIDLLCYAKISFLQKFETRL